MSDKTRFALTLTLLVASLACIAAAVVVIVQRRGGDDTQQVSDRYSVPELGAPDEPDEPIPQSADTPEVVAAKAAARRFLRGYLPYSYGHGPARAISDVAPPLAATLRRAPPRVPPAIRKLDGRLVAFTPQTINADTGIDLEATIRDPQRTYTIDLAVRATEAGRWLVVAVA